MTIILTAHRSVLSGTRLGQNWTVFDPSLLLLSEQPSCTSKGAAGEGVAGEGDAGEEEEEEETGKGTGKGKAKAGGGAHMVTHKAQLRQVEQFQAYIDGSLPVARTVPNKHKKRLKFTTRTTALQALMRWYEWRSR